MNCPQTWSANAEFLKAFNRKAVDLRLPLAGSLELTRRCNLRCVHCYLGADRFVESSVEMGTERVLRLLDELSAAGCLYLLITGGDPLLRADFPVIHRRARELGFVTCVFTNGTSVTDTVLETFAEFPPGELEISLYGATAAVHEAVAGVAGSHRRCLEGLDRLSARGLKVRLKTILMTVNRHELGGIEALARERGLEFRLDSSLFPRWDGDTAPLGLRLPVEEAVALEFSDPLRSKGWREFHARTADWGVTNRLYNCGAGLTSFHIDADGTVRPCLMVHDTSRPLVDGNFLAAWREIVARIDAKPPAGALPCRACGQRFLCGYCPGHFASESGAEDRPTPYLCDLGKHRLEAIRS